VELGCPLVTDRFLDESGHKIVAARHVGFTNASHFRTPAVVELLHLDCVTDAPQYPHLRHAYENPSGVPVMAESWTCCEAHCTDAEVLANDCYKEPDCWPLGPGPGITKYVRAYVSLREPCTGLGKLYSVILTYDETAGTSGDPKWLGRVPSPAGDLCLAFSCDPLLAVDDPGKFVLEYQLVQCTELGNVGVAVAGYACPDPLRVSFTPFGLPLCCTPPGCDPVFTTPNVTVYVVANCRKVVWGRHYGFYEEPYTGTGEAPRYPLIATDKPCPWHADSPPFGCCGGDIPGALTFEFYNIDTAECCPALDGLAIGLSSCDNVNEDWSGSTFACGYTINAYVRCYQAEGGGYGYQWRYVVDPGGGSEYDSGWNAFDLTDPGCTRPFFGDHSDAGLIEAGLCSVSALPGKIKVYE
jgi:hypothetical protein